MYDIITTGSALVDVFVDTGLREVRKGKRMFVAYPSGYKISVKKMNFSIGGGGTNTAVAFSRLGLRTAYLGKLGNDKSSDDILDSLKKERVDFIGGRKKATSGHSIILDSYGHNRTILTFKGPSDELAFKDIELKKIKTKWIYLASAMNQTFRTQEKLSNYAKKRNIKIAFNPSEYEVKLGIEKLKGILKNTDVLILNRSEAEILSKKKRLRKIFEQLSIFGISIICITNGKRKAYAYQNGEIFSIKPEKIQVIDATGAGDAFASGFLIGLIKKQDIKFALKLGLANSQSVIQHYGSKNKLLRWSEAVNKLNH